MKQGNIQAASEHPNLTHDKPCTLTSDGNSVGDMGKDFIDITVDTNIDQYSQIYD